jgi:hypothetical protein
MDDYMEAQCGLYGYDTRETRDYTITIIPLTIIPLTITMGNPLANFSTILHTHMAILCITVTKEMDAVLVPSSHQ